MQSDFYRGRYTTILQATVDGPGAGTTPLDAPWVVGALSFRGRLFEAETIYAKHAAAMASDDRCAARCFLAMNLARASHYARARALLVANARARRESDRASFYCWLGLAFYHSTQDHAARAEKFALRALGRALDDEFAYGKILARDLLAHRFVKAGRMSAALLQFSQAETEAATLGGGAIVEALRVSLALHSARHGFSPHEDLTRLESLRAELTHEDSFSEAKLLMELGRQSLLRGKATVARDYYQAAAKVVGASEMPWFKSLLAVRQAHLAWCCGDEEGARIILAHAEDNNVEKGNTQAPAEIGGLRSLLANSPSAETRLSRPAPIVHAVDARIRRRQGEMQIPLHPPGDDPLGDLLDGIQRDPTRAADAIIRAGYFGLLARLPGAQRGGRALDFALAPARVVVFDHGNVALAATGTSALLERLAESLATGWHTKESLVHELWGYRYDPLKHDPLVYRAIGRLRSILPEHWVACVQSRYRLAPGIAVVRSDLRPDLEPVRTTAATLPSRFGHDLRLSPRQMRLASFIERTGPTDVTAASAFLGLSPVSARRELAHLVRHDYILRLGKGRATLYQSAGSSGAKDDKGHTKP